MARLGQGTASIQPVPESTIIPIHYPNPGRRSQGCVSVLSVRFGQRCLGTSTNNDSNNNNNNKYNVYRSVNLNFHGAVSAIEKKIHGAVFRIN